MFAIRKTKPEKGNKFYNTTSNGGYSRCIQGKPTDAGCNVLANCVGYACGRFNEIIGSMKYPQLNCNAENFIERAKSAGLEVVDYPVLGGIMVMQKGATLSGNDGAGHVFIVEDIYDANTIYTSESGYGGSAFWNSKRSNSNGRWGHASSYKFRGCIVNPSVGKVTSREEPKPTPTPTPKPEPKPTPTTYNVGDEVIVNGVLTADSYGGGAHTKNYKNQKAKIIIIKNDGRPRPYALNMNNNMNGVTGWGSKDQIRK